MGIGGKGSGRWETGGGRVILLGAELYCSMAARWGVGISDKGRMGGGVLVTDGLYGECSCIGWVSVGSGLVLGCGGVLVCSVAGGRG